jgi:hypothetical protein
MNKLSALSAAVLLVLGTNGAEAALYTSIGNNFTFLGATGGLFGGTNDVTFSWDGTLRSAVVTDGSSNASLSSPTNFAGKKWTAHNLNMYGSGTYVFDTQCPAGNPACGSGPSYTFMVPTGYIGAHMLWDWSTSKNIDQLQLFKLNDSWNATGADPFCAAPQTLGGCSTNPNPNGNTGDTVWSLVSVWSSANPIPYPHHGVFQIDGPIQSGSMNFNLMTSAPAAAPVPVPAAAWLLGSGLLGLAGVAKRRKMA